MTVHFCPLCLSLLHPSSQRQLVCTACPYIYKLHRALKQSRENSTKKPDEVIGGPDAYKHASTCSARCPRCFGEKALYFEIQTRSADEPSTIFYRCTVCEHDWKE